MKIQTSERMSHFGPGAFAELAGLKHALMAEGRPVIDLSIGSPDTPPPMDIRTAVSEEAQKPGNYVYSLGDLPELRRAAQSWYARRYGVPLDADREILSLYGAEDALVHFLLAFVNPGDKVLVPNPYFPAVMAGVHLAGAQPVFMPLRAENNFLIDLSAISETDAEAAKVMIVSYPNNPTSAVAPDRFYEALVRFAQKYNILVLHDNAYSEMVYDGPLGKSFLCFDGAKEVGVEINSLSKTYSIPGARLAFLVGNADAVTAYARLKSNLDLGSFLPTQYAAIAALNGDQACVEELRTLYKLRRDALVNSLRKIGLSPLPCHGTLFVWVKLPDGWTDDQAFARALLAETGVLLAPGCIFGSEGRGYLRFSLMCSEAQLRKAAAAIGASSLLHGPA